MRFFFVVGCGRSGTTLLQQALNRHPQVAIPPETGFFLDLLGHSRRGQEVQLARINEDLGIDLRLPGRRAVRRREEARALYEEMARLYARRLGRPEVSCFGDKSPRHLLVLERIERLFPDARVVLVFRDGRDVAISLTEVAWGPSDLQVNFGIWLRFARAHRRALERAAVPICQVRYEDLVTDPHGELARVAEFLDLPFVTAMADGAGNREGVPEWEMEWKGRALEPIHTGRLGLWRRKLSRTQVGLLEAWGGETLERLGYDRLVLPRRRPPVSFLLRYWRKITAWRLKRTPALLGREILGRLAPSAGNRPRRP